MRAVQILAYCGSLTNAERWQLLMRPMNLQRAWLQQQAAFVTSLKMQKCVKCSLM